MSKATKRMSQFRFEMFGSGGHVQDNHTYELWEWLKAERAAYDEEQEVIQWLANRLLAYDMMPWKNIDEILAAARKEIEDERD